MLAKKFFYVIPFIIRDAFARYNGKKMDDSFE
jgi:hypothetical protein